MENFFIFLLVVIAVVAFIVALVGSIIKGLFELLCGGLILTPAVQVQNPGFWRVKIGWQKLIRGTLMYPRTRTLQPIIWI